MPTRRTPRSTDEGGLCRTYQEGKGRVMAQVWQCDRCEVVSKNGNVDDPPDGWERRDVPVRGSQGARSSMTWVLCNECDDDLYLWCRRGWMKDGLKVETSLDARA